MPSNNHAIIAAAGSRKTQHIVDQALASVERRVLITTYTQENVHEIVGRLRQVGGGGVPSHISVTGWLTFLLNECARPYQRAVIGRPNLMRSLNFLGERGRYIKREQAHAFFMDSKHDVYRNGVAHLAHEVNRLSGGLVVNRLTEMFDSIYIDEVQDLVGWDLEFLDLLMLSPMDLTIVGDPRQYTYATNTSPKNKKYQGIGFLNWLAERKSICTLEQRQDSHRCNQEICNFADELYPDLPSTRSCNPERTGHDGIVYITQGEVPAYMRAYEPTVLRYNEKTDTLGLAAKNFGLSKGATYRRVLIFPTQSMLRYLVSGDLGKLGSKEKLYVAVTRAKYSVAFVVPDNFTAARPSVGAVASALSMAELVDEAQSAEIE